MSHYTLSNPKHPLHKYIDNLQAGQALLKDTPENVLEVVGILKSYGIVLEAYYKNLLYIAQSQFLELFPFFKYFNGDFSNNKLLRHWWHDRINYEYAEYCMRTMLWHGGGGLDQYLDTPEFVTLAKRAIAAKVKNNLLMGPVNAIFPEMLVEQVRQSAYYQGLGLFWEVMSEMFLTLSDKYDRQEITTIPQVVEHILNGLVNAANNPMVYSVKIKGETYDIVPASAKLTFLIDLAVPYVEAVFFRGTPFMGTVSYNAQALQIAPEQSRFTYGALYADPLPIGGAGIPPTLLMQDMRHYLPDYLHDLYKQTKRQEDNLRVQICESFQKSMFCVTTAAILGLAPYSVNTKNPAEIEANQLYFANWLDRFVTSRIQEVNQ
jgi:CO2 hydration protein